MTHGRFVAIIVVVTFLGLITVWQQIQTVRWGYQISEAQSTKAQLVEEQKAISSQLSQTKSPQGLLGLARARQISLAYPRKLSGIKSEATAPHHDIAGLREQ